MKVRNYNPQYMAVVFCVSCSSNRVDIARWVSESVGRAFGEKAVPCLIDAVQDVASPDVVGIADKREVVHSASR